MRHHKGVKKLNRNGSHRRSLLRNLAIALFRHERIETTVVKAKALRPFAERLITLAKRGDLHARRLAGRHVADQEILSKLFADLGPRFSERAGGYTRVLRTRVRRGDNATQALIELTERTPSANATATPEQAPAEASAG